jgi:nitroimidazol reductase NimA-like FMN-containing flavoprotein (pyridoxamine 5'-phosphate oxidase superfamily)
MTMRESPVDLQRLQALLDDSITRASAFLRSSFEMPEHSLSAMQLTTHLQGAVTVALATVTAKGEPRVAPINAFFLRGQFYVPTVAEATRTRHLSRRPGASLTYFEGTALAVIAHGEARIISADHRDFSELDATQVAVGNQSVREWEGHGVYLQLRAGSLYTFAHEPAGYPETSPHTHLTLRPER